MRWKGRRESANVEDRRSVSPRTMGVGGGLLGLLLVLIVVLLGGDPRGILQVLQNNAPPPGAAAAPEDPAEDELRRFVAVVLADTEQVWGQLFRQMGRAYREPTLVLFRDAVQSACGFTSAATGPFYCPADQQVYLDLGFFDEMDARLHAPGDFARAYVVAHEIGHHVQSQLGITGKVQSLRNRLSEEQSNRISVRLELQADFLAGVWAHHAQRNWRILEPGDIEEALNAASAIGDDRLQRQAQGYVVPESFTHGTSAQRVEWFRRGLESGDISQGDTFAVRDL